MSLLRRIFNLVVYSKWTDCKHAEWFCRTDFEYCVSCEVQR